MECQLCVAQSQNLSLSLKKSFIFQRHFEFVGIGVCPEGNCTAMSKHHLIKHWAMPVIIREVAKFVGFMQFYSRFIPNFKVRISPSRDIMLNDYTEPIGASWTTAAASVFENMQGTILADPCLHRYNHRKLWYFTLTSPTRDLVAPHANQRMTRPPSPPCIDACVAMVLTS
jgi:hypothetical protein